MTLVRLALNFDCNNNSLATPLHTSLANVNYIHGREVALNPSGHTVPWGIGSNEVQSKEGLGRSISLDQKQSMASNNLLERFPTSNFYNINKKKKST